ncbi:MAG: hypothetical protein OER43_12185 [Gammaproteobacteria bacterium]|nr:hypothetical protein [Gammaproteobacteria bacterium]
MAPSKLFFLTPYAAAARELKLRLRESPVFQCVPQTLAVSKPLGFGNGVRKKHFCPSDKVDAGAF